MLNKFCGRKQSACLLQVRSTHHLFSTLITPWTEYEELCEKCEFIHCLICLTWQAAYSWTKPLFLHASGNVNYSQSQIGDDHAWNNRWAPAPRQGARLQYIWHKWLAALSTIDLIKNGQDVSPHNVAGSGLWWLDVWSVCLQKRMCTATYVGMWEWCSTWSQHFMLEGLLCF